MPWTHLLPPDTRIAGDPNPALDMDGVVDACVALGSNFNVLNPALAGGADPTGAASSTAAIQAAEDLAATFGGVIGFPAGTYKAAGLVKKSLTGWKGDGRGGTIIQLAAASNAPLLTSYQFSSLTMTGSVTSGISSFFIRDMTFDGNASGQSGPSAFGVGIYGCDYQIENVSIRNFLATDGLYTEFGPAGGTGLPDKSMESSFRFLRIHDNTLTGDAWRNRGPHDSVIGPVWIYQNTTSANGYHPEATYATYTATGLSGTAVSSTPATITLNTTLNLPAAGTVTMPSVVAVTPV
jgi:hypothetical protein